jgi:hypothetical protein
VPVLRVSIVVGRTCAALAVASAGLHVVLLGHAANATTMVVMAAMAAVCLYCAHELWRGGSDRAWVVVALMNLAMIAVHLPAPAHHHGAGPGPVAPQSTVMALATVVALVEALIAATVLSARSRGRAAEVIGTRDRTAAGPVRGGLQARARSH